MIPVYEPGHYIDGLIDSLRAQTLDAAEWEAIFVDDGSTDSTPALLDRLAAESSNIRVLHTPPSGWPGRPRNIGIAAARGDYVYLADHDDRLDPQALERLTRFAFEHRSDVVIGTVVGVGRSAPERIFERTVVDAQRDPALLMTSLTPHKLFRRAFLAERDIRFPEGVRRLEDHLFVTEAYLRAERVSIYADHPVYFFVLRDDGRNASRRPVQWRGYFEDAAESIRVVDAEAPDEATRVIMRRRWLQTEALGRLRGSRLLRVGEDRSELLDAVRTLVREHYPLEEIGHLGPGEQVAARLLLDGRDADLVAFAEWEASARVRPEVLDARFDTGGRTLTLAIRAIRAVREATAPLPPILRDPPTGYPARADIEGLVELAGATRLELRFRRAGGTEEVAAQADQSVEAGVLAMTARFDVAAVAALGVGRWRLVSSVSGSGRIPAESVRVADGVQLPRRSARSGRYRVLLRAGERHGLVVEVRRRSVLPVLRRGASKAARLVRRRRRAAGALRRRLWRVLAVT